jgi:Velvet factor
MVDNYLAAPVSRGAYSLCLPFLVRNFIKDSHQKDILNMLIHHNTAHPDISTKIHNNGQDGYNNGQDGYTADEHIDEHTDEHIDANSQEHTNSQDGQDNSAGHVGDTAGQDTPLLVIRQQPDRARSCGNGCKDFRNIDPIPIIKYSKKYLVLLTV